MKKKKVSKKRTYTDKDIVFVGEWYIVKDYGLYAIRREVKVIEAKSDREIRKSQRLDIKKYRHLLERYKSSSDTLQTELEKICVKENTRQFGSAWLSKKVLKKIMAENPWITPRVREKYRRFVDETISSTKDANYQFNLCETKFLKYFLDLEKISDPMRWASRQHAWGQAILNNVDSERYRIWEKKDYLPSEKTIYSIIQAANKFVSFASKTVEGLEHFKPLEPLTRSQIKNYIAQRAVRITFNNDGYFMPKEDYNKIIKLLKNKSFIQQYLSGTKIAPYIELCYYYGLRRSESLALSPKDLKRGYLRIERQQVNYNIDEGKKFSPTKGRFMRKTPHWYLKPDKTYELLMKINNGDIYNMHQDTLSSKFKIAIDYLLKIGEIQKRYVIQDCRRTFITTSLRKHAAVDVQMAAGHKDLTTTLGYQRDDRALDDDVFIPGMSG